MTGRGIYWKSRRPILRWRLPVHCSCLDQLEQVNYCSSLNSQIAQTYSFSTSPSLSANDDTTAINFLINSKTQIYKHAHTFSKRPDCLDKFCYQFIMISNPQIFYMTHCCQEHASLQILLICLDSKCQQKRICCLRCADEYHVRHELISLQCFQNMMEERLQINRNNPEKPQILKQLNKSKLDILKKLQKVKNRLIGLVGECEEKIEKYYSRIFHSFVIDSHQTLLKNLEQHFHSEKISQLIDQMKEFDNITLGSIAETYPILYCNLEIFKVKVDETLSECQNSLTEMSNSFNFFTIAKPKEFLYRFSREKKNSNLLALSDCQQGVTRTNGSGGYPMCLIETPFNPINKSIVFSIDKTEGSKKSICLGVCLENIVKAGNFANCGGFNKGIYAIDQNNPYNSDPNSLASWNHHDSAFNQSNVGGNNLVGWSFSEGDKIRIEVDYYNSIVTFIKGEESEWEEEEEIQVYQMPIRLNSGPLHAFVSCQNKGDRVSIRRT